MKSIQRPSNLKKVMEITERYFHEHGELKPTTVFFTDEGFSVKGHAITDYIDKFDIADRMVAAAVGGASAVAFVAEGWLSESRISAPSHDSKREECLLITFEEPEIAHSCMCKINRQRYGAPRLSNWKFHTVQTTRVKAGRLECIFERARVRAKTLLTCDVGEPHLMLLMTPDGQCLKNSSDEVLVVSSLLMARESIERWTDGGDFRCVLAKDHVDKLVLAGGFRMTGTDDGFQASPDRIAEINAGFEHAEKIMEMEMGRNGKV